jgi:non-canonical poly(A) RNA polymerase PAPD5/7
MDDLEFIPFGTLGANANASSEEKGDDGAAKAIAPALVTSTAAPWLQYSDSGGSVEHLPPFVHLHNEILTFCEYIAPTRKELNQRDIVLKGLTTIIQKIWPTCTVHVFGSQMTKILTPTSDLDIAVLDVPMKNNEEMADILTLLAEKIKSDDGFATYVEAITHAKVPIVKLDHRQSGISIDICVNNDSGLRTGAMIRKLVREFPPLRPLTIVLKVFLSQRGMNDTYSGGIGSFVLCAIVSSFLQMRQRQAAFTKVKPSWNLGALLLEFLQLYGVTYNYMTVGISITNGGEYFNKRKRKADGNDAAAFMKRPNLLYIENPDEPDQDMGGNSFMVPKIKRSFEHGYQVLSSALSSGSSSGNRRGLRTESYLAYVIRSDDPSLADRPGPDLCSNRSNSVLYDEEETGEESDSGGESDSVIDLVSDCGAGSNSSSSNGGGSEGVKRQRVDLNRDQKLKSEDFIAF